MILWESVVGWRWGLRGSGPALAGKLGEDELWRFAPEVEVVRFQCSLWTSPAAAPRWCDVVRKAEGLSGGCWAKRPGLEKLVLRRREGFNPSSGYRESMTPTLRSLRALADPTRLRIVALLESEELPVNEIQEITSLGQSRVSTHLSLLAETGLVLSRRDGKRTFYRLNPQADVQIREFTRLAMQGAKELPEHEGDQLNLRRVLARREEQAQVYFNQVAGRFDRSYGPGRSWQAFGHLLLRMLPAIDVADLGSGEGLLAELLARRCRTVIAVDNSEKMVQFGAKKARQNGLTNLEFRQGDLQSPPIEPASVDLVILSQALHHAEDPSKALLAAAKILRPGGRVMILELVKHRFVQARELYGDRWLGFAESDLHRWLEAAGFSGIEITKVAREEQEPCLETLLAVGNK